MVIQRWQSVLLLIAAMCMALFCFTPFASFNDPVSAESVMLASPSDFIVFLVLNLTIAALLFISIFLFTNLKRQLTVTLLSILLMIVSAVTGIIIVYVRFEGGHIELCGGALLLILALVASLLAYRRIAHDRRLLASMDRIR